TYSPKNYKEEYFGNVTVREALALSLNVATVNLAQMVGYEKIRDLAMAAGINNGIQATPAIALGAYDATPLQIAGAYTIFSNDGVYEKPRIVLAVKDSSGRTVWQSPVVSRRVLDPRVSYLCVNLMETVIDHGTGEGARARGFYAPAAGKTGTSHDGWFSGFTSNLLATAWVGYDNDQDLDFAGASSALPIWTEFMKEAIQLPGYRNVQPFTQPLGIITAPVSSQTALLTANNPLATPDEVFIDGTEPVSTTAASTVTNLLRKILPFGRAKNTQTPAASAQPQADEPPPSPAVALPPAEAAGARSAGANAPPPPEQPKPSVMKRFISIFHHHKNKPDPQSPDQTPER
ncbi:MAG: penicillin-binding protein, partial [Acidobacteriota bacterium]|nr:penicillin-binding protein [Acidobacteriota bacterium]